MDFAADAVFEPIAAPSRAAAPRAAPADASEPSFADHLEAATADDAPAPYESAPDPEPDAAPQQPRASESSASQSGEVAAAVANGAEQSAEAAAIETPAPAFIVQVVATPASPAVTTDSGTGDNPSQSATPTAPALAAPAQTAPAETAASGSATAGPTPASAAAPAQNERATSGEQANTAPVHGSAKSADAAPQNNGASVPTQPTQPTQANVAPPPVTPAASADADSALAAAAAAAGAAQSAQPSQPREGSQRTGKSEPNVDKNAGAQPTAQPLAAATPQRAATAKSATNQAAKDSVTSAPSPTIEAPQAPPPQSPAASAASTHAASHTQQAAPDQAARAAPAAAQIAREIVRQFNGQSTSFELRLDPPELGRVDVRLEVSRDHRVTALIAADSPQALAELARNARELEQMLQSAGLELSDNGLAFDLRQGHEGSHEASDGGAARGGALSAEASEVPQQQSARPLGYERWRGVRLDMMV